MPIHDTVLVPVPDLVAFLSLYPERTSRRLGFWSWMPHGTVPEVFALGEFAVPGAIPWKMVHPSWPDFIERRKGFRAWIPQGEFSPLQALPSITDPADLRRAIYPDRTYRRGLPVYILAGVTQPVVSPALVVDISEFAVTTPNFPARARALDRRPWLMQSFVLREEPHPGIWTEPGVTPTATGAWTEPALSVITTSWTEPATSPITSTWTEPGVTPITPSPDVT